MKFLKKMLCVFLAAVLLFFSVDNSRLSPHKMDTVEASSIVVGGVAVSVDLIIKLIAALGVAGLSCALIDNISEWNWKAVLDDVHDWLRDNMEVLDQHVTEGTSALKEWAQADYWTLVETFPGGGQNPEPSPSPDSKYAEKVWGSMDMWRLGELAMAGGYLAQEVYNKHVPQDESVLDVAQAYMRDKISGFWDGSPTADTDPVMAALKDTFTPSFDGALEYDESGCQVVRIYKDEYGNKTYLTKTFGVGDRVCLVHPEGGNAGKYGTLYYIGEGMEFAKISLSGFHQVFYSYDGSAPAESYLSASTKSIWLSPSSVEYTANVPVFRTVEEAQAYLESGNLAGCINLKRNYIDSSDAYGWAGTANLSPSGLLASLPALLGNLAGAPVSLSGLTTAADAFKHQLDVQNPNFTPEGVPVPEPAPYPDVQTFIDILEQVLPETFPQPEPQPEPDPEPTVSPSASPSPSPRPGEDKHKGIVDLSRFFPFCIPFDLIHLLGALDAEPEAPRFTVPIKSEKFGLDYEYVIDLSVFDEVAAIFRLCEELLFILGLILLTRNLIRG